MKIDADVLAILRAMKVDGLTATLPPGQLPRNFYERVDKVLKALGGKWNRKSGGHVFARDPRPLLGQSIDDGTATDEKKLHGRFYTPPEIARRMVMEADLRAGLRILEPSCGDGRLIRAIGEVLSLDDEADVLGVDIDSHAMDAACAEFLSATRRRSPSFVVGDFLELEPAPAFMFDRVLMNPPFAKGADLAHIRHALSFLKPDGVLVALCAAGTRQRQFVAEHAGSWETLAADSFKAEGTGVNVAMVMLRPALAPKKARAIKSTSSAPLLEMLSRLA
ncbi:MAG TPA: N-6 DNA methylase [Reyranella sp.]|nr:N-6 DNA methylase [Reyranella sp.]